MGERKLVIAVAGASGYIGNNLLKKLKGKAKVIALSRNGDSRENTENVEWRSCDLFSMKDAEKSLAGADIAVYLVHSMLKSAKLAQGTFEDMDVILADNFAQAASKQGIKQIVYLGGIIPDEDVDHLSRHLKSRLEVERILRSYDVPVTALRAGLIVGPKGSSFPILSKLVRRLPMMILPKWTRSNTQPVALDDVLQSLTSLILDFEPAQRSIDIGGPEVMTYKSMMEKTAEVVGKKSRMVDVPFFTLSLSRLWLRLVTQTPKEIVYPLVESLKHPMVVSPANYVKGISDGKIPFLQAAREALEVEAMDKQKPVKKPSIGPLKQDVRSVQRIELPNGWTADESARYYVKWLESFLNPWVKTDVDDQLNCKIGFLGDRTLLELSYSAERSTPDRSLYYITGGLLMDPDSNERGRMEFRKVPGSNGVIIAIHDYLPSIPWFVYYVTQANMHAFVMESFRRHMHRLSISKKGRMEAAAAHL
ncbi:NAD-dependent epimerase/dehydratase family protein [Sporosarcina sp. PTS2304]|uniref:NAD(P)H-binding protein n=1 Tax=Sporosarcina sp. PTS2304 TaxID=2283194 RepID=UPI000E0DDCFF|nr:NAD(P)H-binding protein [Sporosarcina sp. PTS2304]AXI00148.1 NAD-dependent epimerase/dehydratase family protein [Sporosarcina sp. PTS2304]